MKRTTQEWKQELKEFQEQTKAFYGGELDKGSYKSISGYYGSYAQRSGDAGMLRLRMTAGRVTKERMAFTARMLREYPVQRIHFTTCQTIQLHDLHPDAIARISEEALDAGIITIGGGGDYPRNVMCSPLAGVDPEEYFDVLPYAEAASEYLLGLIGTAKLPRKLKVGFSSSPANRTHATFRDLGFAARPDGKFDVYSAGGLGNRPMMGVLIAEAVDPAEVCTYCQAMWLTFLAHGNYQNRGKARSRFMQESLGGPEQYREAFLEMLAKVQNGAPQPGTEAGLRISVKEWAEKQEGACKQGDGSAAEGRRVLAQKQEGLYAVLWHPVGGQPNLNVFQAVNAAVQSIEGAELRLTPDQGAWIINLTGAEAEQMLKLTAADSARSQFERSVACIGASTCQIGVGDSQALLRACVEAVREAGIPDGALPQIHISGCPSSCGTHQIGRLGFRGGMKRADGEMCPAFTLYAGGCDVQGRESMGREIGTMLARDIPEFLVKLGQEAAQSGMEYGTGENEHPERLEEIAKAYLK